MEDLLPCKARLSISDFVRKHVLRDLAVEEEKSFASTIDSENAMPWPDPSISRKGVDFNQRSNVVRVVGKHPDTITSQIGCENIGICRINDDLVNIAAVLPSSDRAILFNGRVDDLNWACPWERPVILKSEDADGACIATRLLAVIYLVLTTFFKHRTY